MTHLGFRHLVAYVLLAATLLTPTVAFAEREAAETDNPELENSAAPADSSTDSATPPDPQHMWNMREDSEDAIMPMSSSPYWEDIPGGRAFYDGDGNLFVSPAMFVVDVSSWQGEIDWDAFKAQNPNAGAILRLGYGEDTVDKWFARNIAEVKRLDIPYGVYLYSYAYDDTFASNEAHLTGETLANYDADPELGIFYDLEAWEWTGHQHPTTPAAYESIVRHYVSTLTGYGWNEDQIHVYSYTSYLKNQLNSSYIHSKTTWVAQYGPRLTFDITADGQIGWQYSSTGSVSGIAGDVDMNAFSALDRSDVTLDSLGTQVSDLPEGDYLLLSGYSGMDGQPNAVIDIGWSSLKNGEAASLYRLGGTSNQIFHVSPNGDGSYNISAKHSGKSLDVSGPSSANGTPIVQWDYHGGDNQRWTIWRDSTGYCYIASVYASSQNKVMTVSGETAADSSPIQLWSVSGSNSQRFRFVPLSEYEPSLNGWITRNGTRYWYESGIRVEGREMYDAAAGGWRWLQVGGEIAYDQDVYIPPTDKWVRLDEEGLMVKGEDYRYGAWYYFDPITGAMAKGVRYVEAGGGKWVYYDVITGKMAHGEAYLSYDSDHTGWYYFDEWTGEMYHGDRYLESSGGKWVRYDHYTGIMVKGLQYWDGSWYYFDPTTGKMAHGNTWVPEWNSWHHFDEWTGRG
ncbi:RICIN domain-containing protein [Enorma burkinafasonensis]|uniref:RICIN domain-containing protein n=1 Tax=Enorma burkinafasonensis TaxID=2590867 RepID=UPI0011A03F9F|nr:RICIN domain-containing protein [Enorma burkinafasonensis]